MEQTLDCFEMMSLNSGDRVFITSEEVNAYDDEIETELSSESVREIVRAEKRRASYEKHRPLRESHARLRKINAHVKGVRPWKREF